MFKILSLFMSVCFSFMLIACDDTSPSPVPAPNNYMPPDGPPECAAVLTVGPPYHISADCKAAILSQYPITEAQLCGHPEFICD